MNDMFRSFDPPARSPSRWMASLVVHVVVIGMLVGLSAAVKLTPVSRVATLIDPLPAPTPLPPPVIRLRVPKITSHVLRPMPVPVKIEAKLPAPAIVPAPEAPKIEAARMTEPEPRIDLPPMLPAPKAVREVKVGGFGDPNGVPALAASKSHALAVAGSFDLPQGTGRGGGGGRVVAAAGFGDGGLGGSGSAASHGTVRSAGFANVEPVPVAALRSVSRPAFVQTPVEILSKPRPVYTAEARASKLEGEVLLEVVFSASGAVHVIRVVRGLGLGLDESARQAALQIRFRPGTRDGAPVDMKGIVHIVFELS